MSAFDITGAIVWSPVACLLLWAGIGCLRSESRSRQDAGPALFIGTLCALGAVFSVARLLGAHA